jgi:excisionase family DNA binding protein
VQPQLVEESGAAPPAIRGGGVMTGVVGFLVLNEETQRYLVQAAALGRRALMARGITPPSGFDRLLLNLDSARRTAPSRTEPQKMDHEGARPEAECVDVETSARMLGISKRTAETLISDGRLPSRRIGRRRVVRVADIADYARDTG